MRMNNQTLQLKRQTVSAFYRQAGLILCLMAISFSVWASPEKASAVKSPEAQQQETFTVKGVVKDETGETLPGVAIAVKGTALGTVTDLDGQYSIQVPKGSVLSFSYMGYETITKKVDNPAPINLTMQTSAIAIEEVVVTAMGVKAEKKKLNFAVQSLGEDQVTAGQSTNFVKTLQGKIAGVQTSNTGGAVNASTNIVIRAISSINPSQSNEPLFIVDGMPVRGGGTAAGDINPNDIENVTVLKGAAASALYGQDGANGVIMITTKTAQAGKMVVNGNVSIQLDNVANAPEIQQMFIPGARGFIPLNQQIGGWGPLLYPGEQVYDNIGNYFQTGLLQKYDLNASGGTEKFKTYASVNFLNHEGVVPKEYKNRLGLLLKGNFEISKTVNLTLQNNYIENQSRGASMGNLYSWPINDNMENYKNSDGSIRWVHDMSGMDGTEKIAVPMNPYWGRYEDYGKSQSTRNILQGALEWKPIKDLSLSTKVSYDRKFSTYDGYSTPRFTAADFPDIAREQEDGSIIYEKDETLEKNKSLAGEYLYQPSNNYLLTFQALGSYNLNIKKDFDLGFLLGFEMTNNKGEEATMGGAQFVLPGDFYSIQNIGFITTDTQYDYGMRLYHFDENKFGYFGELRFDYKGIANISGTGRFDMSSTLTQKTYFYPSVTAGLTFSELFGIAGDVFSYGKLRGNWAKVGKCAPRYRFDRNFKQWSTFPDGGFGLDATVGSANNIDPEMTSTWEVGADLRFFNNKTRLEVVYYKTTVENQIVTVRVSPASGMILQTRNEGAVSNKGMEITIGQDIFSNRDFKWNADLNFSYNRGRVENLPDELNEIQGTQYGDIFPTAYLHGSTTSIFGKDYERSPDGKIVCDETGRPIISSVKGTIIGDREPDFIMGLTNTFSWKDLSFSFLLDGRKGGDVANITARSLFSNGQHKSLEKYRNREVIFDGVVKQSDGTYLPNEKPVIMNQRNMIDLFYNVSSNFIEDGSYIRLTYVTVSYDFQKFLKKTPIKNLKLAATGQNLLLFTKYTGSDPQIGAGSASGTGSFGIDNSSIPNVRSFNFSLTATF